MKILAIETSCDDTGIAILETSDKGQETGFKVLANIVSSQKIHANYGGVFPMMAKREHQANLVPVLMQALKESKLLKPASSSLRGGAPRVARRRGNLESVQKILEKENHLFGKVKEFLQTHQKPDIDLIAITCGPGLEPCLWVGVNFAKALSYVWDIAVVPVNHIEAHIAVNFLGKNNGNPKSKILNPKQIQNPKSQISKQLFPAISLIVSGGHTQLILVKGIGKYKIIGETRDDAAGECFDKCAKMLGLGYPGGPIISKIASEFKLRRPTSEFGETIMLPRPMIHSKDYDFSFSGLKTAVLYAIRDKGQGARDKKYVQQMCFEVQQAIIDVLIKKTFQAAKDFNAKAIILGGGVSANQELRKQFTEHLSYNFTTLYKSKTGIKLIFSDPKLSTDNALMIAVAGYFNRAKKIAWNRLSVHANLRVGK